MTVQEYGWPTTFFVPLEEKYHAIAARTLLQYILAAYTEYCLNPVNMV